jgi:hypothetical protein
MKHLGKALCSATDRHRIIAAITFALLWAALEFWLQYHTAAKFAEMFGFAPMADRALGALLGED